MIQLNNVTVSGGQALASDTVSGTPNQEYQLCKISLGGAGVGGLILSAGNPMPVNIQNGVPGQQDNAPFTEGTGAGVVIMAQANDTAPGALTEGNSGVVRQTLDRHLRTATTEESGFIKVHGVSYAIQYAAIEASGSGNNTLVAAGGAGLVIRVLSMEITASAAVNAKVQSGAGGTDITGLAYLAANGGVVRGFNKHGHFQTATATLLNLNLSGAVPVGGYLTYIVCLP